MREKITRLLQRVKGCKVFQTVKNAGVTQGFHRFWDRFEKNPFPVQILLILAYRLALDVLYLAVLSPHYAYDGFTASLSPLPYLCSWLAVLVFSPFVAHLNGQASASSILVTCLNYLYFLPLSSYLGCKGTLGIRFLLVALIYWGILLFLQFRLPILHLRPLSTKHIRPVMILMTVGACLLVLAISGRYTGFRFTLNFLNVYGIRSEAAGYHMPGVISYLLNMMPIVLAVSMLYWLRRKKYVVVLALCVVYIFLFSIAAHKSIFFFLFLTLGSYAFYREWMLQCVPGLLAALAGAAILEEKVIGSYYIMTLFFRRMMYVPVYLSERYAWFFSDNPLNLFRNGLMDKFSFENIYSTGISRVLGEFNGYPNVNANTGLLGDLYANLPVLLGLLLMPLILIICFRVLDLTACSLREKYVVPFAVFFAVFFMNTTWSTVLLTHGFLLACLLLYIFPKEEGLSQS